AAGSAVANISRKEPRMFPFAVSSKFRSVLWIFGIALSILSSAGPMVASATDFNGDYSASNSCPQQFGGIGLGIEGVITPTMDFITPFNFMFAHEPCGTLLLSSWYCGGCVNCIGPGAFFHVGFSTGGQSHTINSAILYNNQATCGA